ncbi:MAG: hypothetical protein ACRETW_12580 [Stenotrophobium sp.]
MKITSCLLLCGLLTAPTLSRAQGFALGYDNWNYRVSGIIDEGGTQLRLHRDLGVRPTSRDSYSLRWDTGPGWWPDVAANYMRVQIEGDNPYTVSGGLQIGPLPILPPASTVLHTVADIHDADLTLSYPLQLGPVRASGGVMTKWLHGHIDVSDSNGDQSIQQIDEIFPMAHLQLDLPLGRYLNLRAAGNAVAYQDDNASELRFDAQFRLLGPLTLNLGWQRKHYRVNDDGYLLNTTLQGVLLGVHLVFN